MHYVPVKEDLSDLIKNIKWLQNHDKVAFEIAQNGNNLYEKLYTLNNTLKDTLEVFKTYASLMKYTPLRPHEKFKIEIDPYDVNFNY